MPCSPENCSNAETLAIGDTTPAMTEVSARSSMREILRRAYPVPDLDKAFRETCERFAREAGQ